MKEEEEEEGEEERKLQYTDEHSSLHLSMTFVFSLFLFSPYLRAALRPYSLARSHFFFLFLFFFFSRRRRRRPLRSNRTRVSICSKRTRVRFERCCPLLLSFSIDASINRSIIVVKTRRISSKIRPSDGIHYLFSFRLSMSIFFASLNQQTDLVNIFFRTLQRCQT